MNQREKMAAKADLFQLGKVDTPLTAARAPATMIGQTALQRQQALDQRAHVQGLEEKLKLHEGSAPVIELDPRSILPSKFANRDEANFSTEEFADLKQQIGTIGRNTVPILIRPIKGDCPKVEEGQPPIKYEIVYGLRRHRACMELGINVVAEVRELSDVEHFLAMSAENFSRLDLSTYELGQHFDRALKAKLFQTQTQLAAAHGVSHAAVSRAIAAFNFPLEVLDAFPSKLSIRPSWIEELQRAITERREQVIRTANALKSIKGRTAERVFAKLVRAETIKATSDEVTIFVSAKDVGSVKRTKAGLIIRVKKNVLPLGREQALADGIAKLLVQK